MQSNLQNQFEKGIVIFCGAGASMVPPTCLPSWWEINEQVVKALAKRIEPLYGKECAEDLEKQINERRKNKFFPPEFQAEILEQHFGAEYFKVLQCLDGEEPNIVHLSIAQLAKAGYIRAIVTSNFDRLVERAFEKLKVPLDIYFSTSHFDLLEKKFEESSQKEKTCQLLKLHGSVDNYATLVDTLAQRMRGLPPSLCSCLRHLLRNYYWLFMGFSGADLEGNDQYLCLKSEASHAVGFTWLVRNASKGEPINAVKELSNMYGRRAEIVRGELPDWFLNQTSVFLQKESFSIPKWSDAEIDSRKKEASQVVLKHTTEWSKAFSSGQAADALATILYQSVSNPEAANKLLMLLLKQSKVGDLGHVIVSIKIANNLIEAGELDEASDLLKRTERNIEPYKEKYGLALLEAMGILKTKQGKYLEALNLFNEVYEKRLKLENESNLAIALHNKAQVLTSLGNFELARTCYNEELAITEKLGETIMQAQTLNNIGDLLNKQDKYDEAIKVLEHSVKLRQRLGDDRGVAFCMGNIARSYLFMGDLLNAKAIYEQIAQVFNRLKDKASTVNNMFDLAYILLEMGDYFGAQKKYNEGYILAEKNGFESYCAQGLYKLASIDRLSKNYTKADGRNIEALNIYKRIGQKEGVADVLNEMGILFWETKKWDKAKSAFNNAIAIREKLNQKSGVCQAIGNLALVFMDMGEPKQAIDLLKRKISIAKEIKSKKSLANGKFNLGAAYHRMNLIDEAINSFEESFNLYKEMHLLHTALDIGSLLGEIIGREGRIAESLQWFDKAIALCSNAGEKENIINRLVAIFKLLLENGSPNEAQLYISRLTAFR